MNSSRAETESDGSDDDQPTAVVIAEGATSIEEEAFYESTTLVSISIPASVRDIGERAFYYCSSLSSVVLGEGLATIGNRAFAGCRSLVSISIPASVREIGNQAFFQCSSLPSVVLREGLATIGRYAFYNCNSLTSIIIPDSVIHIHDTAFFGCDQLQAYATAAGLSIEEWGRSNWRKWRNMLNTRFAIVSTVKKLNRHTDDELDLLEVADGSSAELGAVLLFMVECGEEGLVRKIVRYLI
jgi:hypothetical protein